MVSRKTKMRAKEIQVSVLDISLVFSIWGQGSLDRGGVRTAVEISDAFEPILVEHEDLLREASSGAGAEAVDALMEKVVAVTLSVSAFDSIKQAVKDHNKWTNRGARQLLRIEDAFADAKDIDLEPKIVKG